MQDKLYDVICRIAQRSVSGGLLHSLPLPDRTLWPRRRVADGMLMRRVKWLLFWRTAFRNVDIAVVVIPKFEYFDGFIAERFAIGRLQNVMEP